MKPLIKVIYYKHKMYFSYKDIYEKNKTKDSPTFGSFMIKLKKVKSIAKALKYEDKKIKGKKYSAWYLDYKKGNEEHCVSEPEFKRRIRHGLQPRYAILNKIHLRRLRAQNIM